MPIIIFKKSRVAEVVSAIIEDVFASLDAILLRSASTATNGQNNNTIVDTSGTVTPTRAGTVTQGSFSPYGSTGGSLYFNGSTDFITANAGVNLSGNSYTVEAWVYYDGATVGNTCSWIQSVSGYNNWVADFSVGRNSAGNLYLAVNGVEVITTATIPSYTWTHIAVCGNGATASCTIYVNGVAVYTFAQKPRNLALNFYVGKLDNTAGYLGYHKGYVSDLRVINGTSLYTGNFTVPAAPLTAVANTKLLLNGTNAAIIDAVSKTDAVTAGVTTSTAVKKNNPTSMYFDGTSYMTTAMGGLALGSADFTIETWVYPTSLANTYQFVLSKSLDGSVAGSDFDFYIGSSGQIRMEAYSGATQILNLITANGVITTNSWQHIAVTRQNSKFTVWVNGVSVGSATATGALNANASGPMYIGCSPFKAGFFFGYMDEIRITPGVARYVNSFTSPAAALGTVLPATDSGDAYYGQTVLHMHMEGANGSTIFADQKGHVTSAVGGATLTTADKKFGTTSYLSASGKYISITDSTDFQFGNNDFTIECWFKPSTTLNALGRIYSYQNTGSSTVIAIRHDATGKCAVELRNSAGGNDTTITGTTVMTTGNWYHIALTRSNGVVFLYVNGVQESTVTWGWGLGAGIFSIGCYQAGSSEYALGYIDEVRVTKGVARYTSNFTVPSSAFADYQSTDTDKFINQSSLIKPASGTGAFVDSSSYNATIASTGTPGQGRVSPFSSTLNGGSVYFTGSDRLDVASSTNLSLGTGSFTVEFWFNSMGLTQPTNQRFVGNCAGASWGANGWVIGAVSNNLMFQCYNLSTTSVTIQSTKNIYDSLWHHVALVRNGNAFALYVDGVSVGTYSSAGTMDGGVARSFSIGGDGLASEFIAGAMSDVRISNTAIYTAAFTPPTAPLTASASTKLLVNGTNAAIVDVLGRSDLIPVGTPKVIAGSKKYGSSAMYFNGSSYLKTDTNAGTFGTGDFTIEFWLFFTGRSSSGSCLFNNYSTWTTGALGIFAGHGGADTTKYQVSYNGAGFPNIQSTSPIIYNQWHHVALVRSNNIITLYINGRAEGTLSGANATIVGNGATFIGTAGDATTTFYTNGYMDDLRITKGVARYQANFTVPTKQLPTL